MRTMVAFDAFKHALSNPLLAPKVFNEETFTKTGMDLIASTYTFADMFDRNSGARDEMSATFYSGV